MHIGKPYTYTKEGYKKFNSFNAARGPSTLYAYSHFHSKVNDSRSSTRILLFCISSSTHAFGIRSPLHCDDAVSTSKPSRDCEFNVLALITRNHSFPLLMPCIYDSVMYMYIYLLHIASRRRYHRCTGIHVNRVHK